MVGRWAVVKRDHVFRGNRCCICAQPVTAGEVIYYSHVHGGRVVQHKACMQVIMAEPGIPVGATEHDFSRVRDAIVASGNVYVEVG